MIPVLYPETEMGFQSNGIGLLTDTIEAEVFQRLNGNYELELKYPIDGIYSDQLKDRYIILAKPDPVTDPQPFRIYRINPVSTGTVMVYAQHLAYDLMGIPLSPFSADSAAEAMNALNEYAVVDCPFSFSTSKTSSAKMNNPVPRSAWKTLGGSQGSILDIYGGEYEFDRCHVTLHDHRGTDRGVSIRYGKNLTTLEQDRNCSSVYSGVYPFWISQDGLLVQLPEKILPTAGVYRYTRIMELDLSTEFDSAPTAAQLRSAAQSCMTRNQIGIPDISWKVEFVQLEQTEEYKGTAILERVLLGDTVCVVFPSMQVNASARAVEIRFDPILERYNSVTLGKVRASLADTIVSQQEVLKKTPTKAAINQEIAQKLAAAMGVSGGCIRLLDTNADGNPDELYIADEPDPAEAVKVWRFNYAGWAASKTGYNGPFELGATLEAGLLAKFVTAAQLVAGTIKSQDGNFFCDLDNGIVSIKGLKVTIDTPALKVSGSGDVTAAGSFTAASGGLETNVQAGAVYFRQDGNEVAKFQAGTYNGSKVLLINMATRGILFGRTDDPKLIVNHGVEQAEGYVIAHWPRIYGHARMHNSLFFHDPSNEDYESGSFEGLSGNNAGIGVYGDRFNVRAYLRAYESCTVSGDLKADDLYVEYEKNRVVYTQEYGNVSLYSMESANPVFSDMGTVYLDENGYAEVFLDPVFAKTADLKHQYYVFTSAGKVSKHTDYFTVTGEPGGCIDWIVYYRQKGFTDTRLERKPSDIFDRDYLGEMQPDYSVYESENAAVSISESAIDDYQDLAEWSAEEYLENYEQEIYGYG